MVAHIFAGDLVKVEGTREPHMRVRWFNARGEAFVTWVDPDGIEREWTVPLEVALVLVAKHGPNGAGA